MPIIISGSLVYDHIMNFPDSFKHHIMPEQVHVLNVSFVVDRLQKSWGGTAGNIAYTAKLLSMDPLIVSALGNDAREYIDHLKNASIKTSGILIDQSMPTASAYITTDADDNQITAFYPGPLARGNELSVSDIGLPGEIMIIAPTDKQVMMKHLRDAATLGMRVVFDPGQQVTAFTDIEFKQMIEQSEFLIGNDYEIKLIQERTGWSTGQFLNSVHAVITTYGEKGSVVETNAETIEVPACKPQSVDDPTGAGDAYRAGFFVGVQLNYALKICTQIGSVAASYAIEAYGTQAHRFTKEEFGERYENAYRETIIL